MNPRPRPRSASGRRIATVALAGLVVAACAGDPTASPTPIDPTGSSSPTVAPSPVASADASAPPTPVARPTELPGTPFEVAPRAGRTLAVVGIAHDAWLDLRAAPGTEQPVLTRLAPHVDDLRATGRARRLAETIWFEVNARGTVGWVEPRFLGSLGVTVDDTAAIVTRMGGTPVATSPAALALLVADAVASTDPPSRIVITGAPTTGDLAEVTIDVLGVGDDAVYGSRLHIFATPTIGGVSLMSVETTIVCWPERGADEQGRCV